MVPVFMHNTDFVDLADGKSCPVKPAYPIGRPILNMFDMGRLLSIIESVIESANFA